MNRSELAPYVALILMVVGGLFHIDFSEDEKSAATEIVALVTTAGVTAYGIWKNHRKPKE